MDNNILMQGEPLNREKFFSPSREFGIMPFWFWNGEMDYREMEYQLREYYDKGIPAIYIHARFGINDHVPYLSKDWFDRVQFTVKKAQEIGLQVWIYDEYNWPSGTAGQSIMEDKPQLTSRYLELVEDNIPGQYFTFMEGTDSRYHDLEQSEPVYACAILEEDLKAGNPNFINLMPSLSFDKVISWEAPPGPWKLFFFIERKAAWYADSLNPETTREFLERTHQRYKESIGESFSGKIKGFYTDEPAMFYFEIFKNNDALPWSSQLLKIFKEKNGYNLKPWLPMLYYHIGPKTEQVRYDFFSALSAQYEGSYYGQIEEWCKENGVVSTGHLLCEESIRLHARSGGNLFHMLRHFGLTGVDHLYPRVGTREMPSEHVALKIASSAAHQNGSVRLICESMGGLYWDCTLERMKWVADWEYVLGVNILNPHGFHYSIEGQRKRDWPPSQFYHHTWWEEYRDFNQYLTRLGYVLTGGRHVAKLAVLYPINTVWATYTPQKPTPIGEFIEREFPYLADRLLRIHVDYDYLDEDILANAEIQNGRLLIRGEDGLVREEYEALLLPGMTHIKAATLEKLESFVAGGGKVMADTLLPQMCIEGDCTNFTVRVERLFGVNPDEVRTAFETGSAGALLVKEIVYGAGKTVFVGGEGFQADGDLESLRKVVATLVDSGIDIDSEEIFYLHRVKDGEDFLFLVNPTAQAVDTRLKLSGEYALENWNAETGAIEGRNVYRVEKEFTETSLHFEPFGSVLLHLSPYQGQTHICEANFVVTGCKNGQITGYAAEAGEARAVAVTAGTQTLYTAPVESNTILLETPSSWRFSLNRPNCLLTGSWKMRYAGKENPEAFAKDICHSNFSFDGWYDFCMGAWEMQLDEERDNLVYPVDLWYVTHFAVEALPEQLDLLIDGFAGEKFRLFVNGTEITGPFQRSWLDAEIRAASIRQAAQVGQNTVVVLLTVTKKSDGLLDLLKITGNFAVADERITAPGTALSTGDWTTQGFPYYSGAITYTAAFHLPEECADMRILLKADVGTDVLEGWVNDQPAGKCLWRPYAMDLTSLVRPGENKLCLRVVNTLVNLLEGKKQASGLFHLEITAHPQVNFSLK